MNKQIKELEKQCWDNQTNHLNAEKFAQLIVRECMDYASRNWEHGHLLAQDLKTHFGVE